MSWLFKTKCTLCKECSKKIGEKSGFIGFPGGVTESRIFFFSQTKKGLMEDMIADLQEKLKNCIKKCQECKESFAREKEKTLMDVYNSNRQILDEVEKEKDQPLTETLTDQEARDRAERMAESLKASKESEERTEKIMADIATSDMPVHGQSVSGPASDSFDSTMSRIGFDLALEESKAASDDVYVDMIGTGGMTKEQLYQLPLQHQRKSRIMAKVVRKYGRKNW